MVNTFSPRRVRLLWQVEMQMLRRPILGLMGSIFIFTFVLPRMPWLMGNAWSVSTPFSYGIVQDIMVGLIITLLFGLWYLNRRMFFAEPMSFALIPARLDEKAVTLAGVCLLMLLAPQVVVVASFLLDYWVLGDLSLGILGRDYGRVLWAFSPVEWGLSSVLVVLLLSLMLLLTMAVSAMHIRSYVLSLFVSVVACSMVLWLMGYSVVVHMTSVLHAGKVVFNLLLLLLGNFFLARAIYRRLRTVSS